MGDFNNDGMLDVAVGNYNNSRNVGILLNTSNAKPVAVNDSYSVNEDGVLTATGAAVGLPAATIGATGVAVPDARPAGDVRQRRHRDKP